MGLQKGGGDFSIEIEKILLTKTEIDSFEIYQENRRIKVGTITIFFLPF